LSNFIDAQKEALDAGEINEQQYWDNIEAKMQQSAAAYNESLREALNNGEITYSQYRDAILECTEEVVDENGEATGELKYNINAFVEYFAEQMGIALDVADDTADGISNTLSTYASNIKDISDSYDTLADAVYSYNTTGEISVSQFKDLTALGDDWLSYLSMENGQLVINTNAIKDSVDAQIAEAKAAVYATGA
jgi:hypothetical protein